VDGAIVVVDVDDRIDGMPLGELDGTDVVGRFVGDPVGGSVEASNGLSAGLSEGFPVGLPVGFSEGIMEGENSLGKLPRGESVCEMVGVVVGTPHGRSVGNRHFGCNSNSSNNYKNYNENNGWNLK
jgi:hypothetical protein